MSRENLRILIRILIVEDDVLIAMDMQGLLEAEDYRTIWLARSMRAVMDELARKSCDIALLDIGHGDFNVIELTDHLLVEMKVKVIFVTGHSTAIVPERASPSEVRTKTLYPLRTIASSCKRGARKMAARRPRILSRPKSGQALNRKSDHKPSPWLRLAREAEPP